VPCRTFHLTARLLRTLTKPRCHISGTARACQRLAAIRSVVDDDPQSHWAHTLKRPHLSGFFDPEHVEALLQCLPSVDDTQRYIVRPELSAKRYENACGLRLLADRLEKVELLWIAVFFAYGDDDPRFGACSMTDRDYEGPGNI
jgi:hypothetical protein